MAIDRTVRALPSPDEVLRSTMWVLNCVRTAGCESRSEIAGHIGLGKAVVSERVRALQDVGILRDEGQLASAGGRPARRLSFATDLGFVLTAEIAISHLGVAATDLSGRILRSERLDIGMALGPDVVLGEVERHLARLATTLVADGAGVCSGIGIGVAAPVEFATGRTVYPPVHPDWHDQPIRERLAGHFDVPTWVDNEVNLMALAEARRGAAVGHDNALVLKVGSRVGAGLISNGTLHRGAQGCAGSMATASGGDEIARLAGQLARSGASPSLAAMLAEGHAITARDVAHVAARGDEACQRLLESAAEDIGRVLAVVVDVFNPALVVVAGGLAQGGDRFLAKLRETLYGSSIALATRDLQVVRSTLGDDAVALGAAFVALDHVFDIDHLAATLAALGESSRRVAAS